MRELPRPRSIRARYTVVATALSLVVFTIIGATLGVAVHNMVRDGLYHETERVAAQWISTMRYGTVSQTVPVSRVNLLQVVDSHGRVLGASPAMSGKPPLSRVRPPVNDRIQHLTECKPHLGCVVLTAIGLAPAAASQLGLADSPVIYAGLAEPPILATHRLEVFTAAGILLAAALISWTAWCTVGRTLRPVSAIRARMAQITMSDLSLRVPQPPGDDEIARLAATTNQTLTRLQAAVAQQRHFAFMVSHELRNPVAGLHTQLEVALLDLDDGELRDSVEAALSTTDRLQAIIDELLTLARLRTAVPTSAEPIDLSALMRKTATTQVHEVPVRAHADGEVTVRGNPVQLTAVLNNLLVNAERHAETSVEVTVERSDGQAVVTVVDDGRGIAPQDRERVFEPFVRLDEGRSRDPGGNGLGLAISRAIVSSHCGTLRVEDSPRGTKFVLRLPLIDGDCAPCAFDGEADDALFGPAATDAGMASVRT